MEIIEVIKKLPKLAQIIISDSQIVFSGEKEFISEGRLHVLSEALAKANECIKYLSEQTLAIQKQVK